MAVWWNALLGLLHTNKNYSNNNDRGAKIAGNPICTNTMKHKYDARFHFVRGKVEETFLKVTHACLLGKPDSVEHQKHLHGGTLP